MSGNRDPEALNPSKVLLDLNSPIFQANWLQLEKEERHRVTDTLKKIRQLMWSQVYRDQGLTWEKISGLISAAGPTV